MKPCGCGCGTLIPDNDTRNRPRKFYPGHNNKGKSNTWKIKPVVLERTSHERAVKIVPVKGVCGLAHLGHCSKRLEVAHVDGDPFNNDPSNLLSLCQSHHRLLDVGAIDIRNPVMPSFYIDSGGKRRYKRQ